MVDAAPQKYEPSEVSAAKDIALAVLHENSDTFESGESGIPDSDYITIADKILENLIAAGVKIPEVVTSPFLAK